MYIYWGMVEMEAPTWARARMGMVEMAAPTWARARARVGPHPACVRARARSGQRWHAIYIEWRAFWESLESADS